MQTKQCAQCRQTYPEKQMAKSLDTEDHFEFWNCWAAEVFPDEDNKQEIPEYTQGIMDEGAAILADGTPLTIDQILNLLNTNEKLLHDRQQILNLIPDCPIHGQGCIPHAKSWIKDRTPVKKNHGSSTAGSAGL